MGSKSADTPQWMRVSSCYDFEKNGRSAHRFKMSIALCLFGIFLAISIVTIFAYPIAFHLPVIATCVSLYAAMMMGKWETTPRVTSAYFVIGVTINSIMTYLAVNVDTSSFTITLAGVVLFTGLAGLLILSRTRENPSRKTKGAIMVTALAIFATSLAYASVPSNGIWEYARLWLLSAIAPMTFLVVFTFLILMAYHRSIFTLPSDKWT